MKKIGKIIIIILAIFVFLLFLRFVIGGPEDTWICTDGEWTKHGAPSMSKPIEGCGEEKMECSSYTSEICPTECVVCPPCMACSSITCQTEEFCAEMGIDRTWYDNIKENLNKSVPPSDKTQ